MNAEDKQALEIIIKNMNTIVDQKIKHILKGTKLAGKISSINGNRANCFINGSTEITSNIPIRYGLTLKPNDEVWIERINFSDIDLEISSKRNINNEQWGQWINVGTLLNGWVHWGSPFSQVGYKINATGEQVFLKGLIKSGIYGIDKKIFTLPVGYRPPERRVLDAVCANGQVRIDVDIDGSVYVVSGSSNEWLTLDDIDFKL